MAIDQFTSVVLISGVVLVWYLTGLAYNRRLLGAYWVRIRQDLTSLDASPRINAVRTSSLTVLATNLGKHLKHVSISVIVVGRQNPFSYLLACLQKHHDVLSIRADFMKKPKEEFELLNKTYPLASSLLKHAFKDWENENIAGTDFVHCWKYGKTDFSTFKGFANIWRISVRKDNPHLLLTLRAEDRSASQLAWLPDFDKFIVRWIL